MAAKKLSGSAKAAVLMVSLGEELSAELLRQLSPSELQRITRAMSSLGRIDAETVTATLADFSAALRQTSPAAMTDASAFAIKALAKAFPGSKGEALVADLNASIFRLQSIEGIDGKVIARLLVGEQPQTQALVLAACTPVQGGAFISSLKSDLALEVLLRLARIEQVDPEALADLDAELSERLSRLGQSQQQKGGAAQAAAILAQMGGSKAKELLTSLAARDATVAAELGAALRNFASLAKLSDASIRLLLTRIPTAQLRLSLRGASREQMQLFLRNMSTRAGQTLQDDIAADPPRLRQDVEAAQAEILAMVAKLEEEGLIQLADQGPMV